MQDIAELAVEGLVLLDTVMGLFSRRTPMQVWALLADLLHVNSLHERGF